MNPLNERESTDNTAGFCAQRDGRLVKKDCKDCFYETTYALEQKQKKNGLCPEMKYTTRYGTVFGYIDQPDVELCVCESARDVIGYTNAECTDDKDCAAVDVFGDKSRKVCVNYKCERAFLSRDEKWTLLPTNHPSSNHKPSAESRLKCING